MVRCAIYTRKSSGEGRDRAFHTLDAQRDAGEAFVRSQAAAGWLPVPERYDDGGFSGGTTDRPALLRLLADIDTGRIDCMVVYKVDRLSRSLLDFAQMMRRFDERRVAFVSVTQQLNTGTSMGRLVLNVLLSFAQFEREIAGERTRDKIATRRKGKWCGGRPVLGYWSAEQLVAWLTRLLVGLHPTKYRKTRRGPKKPPTAKRNGSSGHVSTHRSLQARKAKSKPP